MYYFIIIGGNRVAISFDASGGWRTVSYLRCGDQRGEVCLVWKWNSAPEIPPERTSKIVAVDFAAVVLLGVRIIILGLTS